MKNLLQPHDLQPGQTAANAQAYTNILLVRLLTDEYSLFLQTLQALWGSKRTTDLDEQDFLEWQFSKMTELTDVLISRVNRGGHFFIHDINEYMWVARLPELLGEETDADICMGELLRAHTTMLALLEADLATVRAERGTESTLRFLEHLREQHQAMADLIRNYPDWSFPGAGTGTGAATVLEVDFREAVLKRVS
jgi:DNA-binding ferritin-like protein